MKYDVAEGTGWRCIALQKQMPQSVLSRYPSATEFWSLFVLPSCDLGLAAGAYSIPIGHVAKSRFGWYPLPDGFETSSGSANCMDTSELAAMRVVTNYHLQTMQDVEFVPIGASRRTLRITRFIYPGLVVWATVTEVTEAGVVVLGTLHRTGAAGYGDQVRLRENRTDPRDQWFVIGMDLSPTQVASQQARALATLC